MARQSKRGQPHRMPGSVSGALRQKGQLSDCRMACPAALLAVHVTPANSPRRMLHPPSMEATCKLARHALWCTARLRPPKVSGRHRSSS